MAFGIILNNINTKDKLQLAIAIPALLVSTISGYIKYAIKISMCASNWPEVFFVTRGLKDVSIIKMVDGTTFKLTKKTHLAFVEYCGYLLLPQRIKDHLKIRKSGKTTMSIKTPSRRIMCRTNSVSDLANEFYYQPHNLINAKGLDVVDIGAYYGETALYYALYQKARMVYGFEIEDKRVKLAKNLITSNNLSNRIKIFNKGVYATQSESNPTVNGEVKFLGSSKNGTTLAEIVRRFKLSGAALKVDIEGAEYDLFKNVSSDDLKKFKEINIEYHFGYKTLVERLRREGYKVMYTKPRYQLNIFGWMGLTCQGDIVAKLH